MRTPSAWSVFGVAVAGVAIFSVMDAVMKGLVLALGTYDALFWRSVAGCVFSGALYLARPRQPLMRARFRVHAWRAVVSTAMALLFFWGLARMPMAQAVALTFVAPLLSLYLAAAFLGERVGRTAVVASSVAFGGVAVILVGQWRADAGPTALVGAAAVLASALLYAVNIVLMRRQAQVADPVEVAFSQSVLVTLLLAAASPFLAEPPAVAQVPALVAAAALGVGALLLMAWAYARADASRLSTSEYTAFVWAAALGWTIFDERLTATTVAGAALIVLGCILAARERPSSLVPEIEAVG